MFTMEVYGKHFSPQTSIVSGFVSVVILQTDGNVYIFLL